jgi:hypothetical protein
VACNYHYLGWVLTWKYLKQGFWGKIDIYIRVFLINFRQGNVKLVLLKEFKPIILDFPMEN